MLVGVDIGGTFTDLVLSTDEGLVIHKLPSTPQNPAEAGKEVTFISCKRRIP